MHLITSPAPLDINSTSIFLAGSIEQDKAENWQNYLIRNLADTNLTLLNPRRESWDASWVQSIENEQFRGQVEWELAALEAADHIVIYFDPNTKSPISLLELGLFAQTGKVTVCCPEGFWRKGNVDIVCKRYGVPQVGSLAKLLEQMRKKDQNK